jgi:hopanoid biosynthesis associated RND transporter like protein HpnN
MSPFLRALWGWLLSASVRLVEASARTAPLLLPAILLLTAGLFYYTKTHLALNSNTAEMLDPNLAFRKTERELDRAFPQLADNIVVVVEADTPDEAGDVADALAARMRGRPEVIDSVYQPGGGPFFAQNGLLYLDTEALWDLDERFAEAEPFLGTMAEDPSLSGLFTMLGRAFDEDLGADNQAILRKVLDRLSEVIEAPPGSARPVSWRAAWLAESRPAGVPRQSFILVRPRLDYTRIEPADGALDYLRGLAADPEFARAGARIRLTGSVAMQNEELANVSEDAGLTTGLSFLLVCLTLFLGLRSPRMVGCILVTLVVGLVWTAAAACFAIGALNLISVNFAVLFIGMGVDFSIQFAMRYREEFDREDETAVQALIDTGAGIGAALAVAAVAAAVSFVSFAPTSYRGLAELGLIAAMSMGVALFSCLTVLPALIAVFPLREVYKRHGPMPLAWLGPFLVRNRRAVLWAGAAVALGALSLAPRVQFDFDPLNLRDPTTEAVATFKDLLKDPDTSPYTIQIIEPDLDAARALAARVSALPSVDKVVTLASYVPGDQEQKLEIIADMNLVLAPLVVEPGAQDPPPPEKTIAVLAAFQSRLAALKEKTEGPDFAASLGRLQEALSSLRIGPDWDRDRLAAIEPLVIGDFPVVLGRLRRLLSAGPVSLDDVPAELRDRYLASDGRARIEVYPKADLSDRQALRDFVAAVRAVAPHAGGSPVALLEGGDAVIEACLVATGLGLVFTGVLMLLVLRKLAFAFMAFVPLVLALILTVGSSVVFSLPFNLANIIALPLLIGLANAYGIYLVMRKRNGGDVIQLFRGSTPVAVLFSALTAIMSFGTLGIARHPGMAYMGILITLSLSYAVLSSIVLLPALMAALDQRRGGAA